MHVLQYGEAMKTILAIDDDKTQLELIKMQLVNMGYTAYTASSGAMGIELAQTGNPDLIILDISMPAMNGFEVIKKLKDDEITGEIPIIMLTAKRDKDDVIRAMRYNVVDYMLKPYNAATLKKKLEVARVQMNRAEENTKEKRRRENMVIHRSGGQTVLVLRGSLKDAAMRTETARSLGSSFRNMIKMDYFIVDIRSLPDFDTADVRVLETLIKDFNHDKTFVIAGQFYGVLVGGCDFIVTDRIFLTPGDLEIFIDSLQ
jgi:CheY-like chemotaxis protein